jgi:hypothetical protein
VAVLVLWPICGHVEKLLLGLTDLRECIARSFSYLSHRRYDGWFRSADVPPAVRPLVRISSRFGVTSQALYHHEVGYI